MCLVSIKESGKNSENDVTIDKCDVSINVISFSYNLYILFTLFEVNFTDKYFLYFILPHIAVKIIKIL